MTERQLNRRDLLALVLASFTTCLVGFAAPTPDFRDDAHAEPSQSRTLPDPALDGLHDASWAEAEGAWWLDDQAVDVKLGYAPEHSRLVWHVSSAQRGVMLDAKTGEALAFEYD